MMPCELQLHPDPSAPLAGAAPGPIPWLPVLETGHETIDREHQALLEDTNALLAIIARRGAWPDLAAAARALRDDCVVHFRNEDRLFEAMRFPGAECHRRSHRRILAEMNRIVAALESAATPGDAKWDLALSLRDILIDHLLREDLAYKSHLMHVEAGR